MPLNDQEFNAALNGGSNDEIDQYFTGDVSFKIVKTTTNSFGQGPKKIVKPKEITKYLEANESNVVILLGSNDNDFGDQRFSPPIYIMRGASGQLNNFYYGDYPPEDPNDVEGGDLTAADALRAATEEYFGG